MKSKEAVENLIEEIIYYKTSDGVEFSKKEDAVAYISGWNNQLKLEDIVNDNFTTLRARIITKFLIANKGEISKLLANI
ncbi:MAG: hypothetical protein ACTSYA_04245 [Candidatus Kariarchaeaceae archaeon]